MTHLNKPVLAEADVNYFFWPSIRGVSYGNALWKAVSIAAPLSRRFRSWLITLALQSIWLRGEEICQGPWSKSKIIKLKVASSWYREGKLSSFLCIKMWIDPFRLRATKQQGVEEPIIETSAFTTSSTFMIQQEALARSLTVSCLSLMPSCNAFYSWHYELLDDW